jgi:hypothetical protein
MPIIYCSVCADANRYTGETCWHCGDISESSYKHTGYRFVTRILFAAMLVGVVWAYAVSSAPYEKTVDPHNEIVTRAPDKLAQANFNTDTTWVLVRTD